MAIRLHTIALVGKMHSGKTTLADRLVTHGYHKYVFSTAVKQEVMKLLGRPVDKGNLDDRNLMQLIGAQKRKQDPYYWIKKTFDTIEADRTLAGIPFPVVIEDCRLLIEAQACQERFYTIVKLSVPIDLRLERAQAIAGREFSDKELIAWHKRQLDPTELEQDHIESDFTFPNETLDDLNDIEKLLIERRMPPFTFPPRSDYIGEYYLR